MPIPLSPPPRKFRYSRLDAHRDIVGKLPDRIVAERLDMSTENVRIYRKARGIPLDKPAKEAATPATLAQMSKYNEQDTKATRAQHAAAQPTTPQVGFYLIAIRAGGEPTKFVAFGSDITAVVTRATAALTAEDSGWRIVEAREMKGRPELLAG